MPAFALPGETVWAMGLHCGVRKRFKAKVVKLRKLFPRIVVIAAFALDIIVGNGPTVIMPMLGCWVVGIAMMINFHMVWRITRACKGLVACGAVRLVTLAVVSERPRRVTKFVRHGTCVSKELAKLVLQAHGGDVDKVPVVGGVGGEELERVRTALRE